MRAAARGRRSRRDRRAAHLAHASDPPPPAASRLLAALQRRARPPRAREVLLWVQAHQHAGTLAGLAHAYLPGREAAAIERSLRAGRHVQAAERFCGSFSTRYFPLDYPYPGGHLLAEVSTGVQHEGFGEEWEDHADLWSLKPVFLLAWSLLEDPYGWMADVLDEEDGRERPRRLCEDVRDAIAELAGVPVGELFAGFPPDGLSMEVLRPRLEGTRWEPLLWAAPWLWRLSGNPFLDHTGADDEEPAPWSLNTVLRLTAAYREAMRAISAVRRFDCWLQQAPAERTRAAVQAALGPPSGRLATLLDLPVLSPGARSRGAGLAPAP